MKKKKRGIHYLGPLDIMRKFGYLEVGNFHGHVALARDEEGYFHVDGNGKPLYDERYKNAGIYLKGKAYVLDWNGAQYYIDKNGNVIEIISLPKTKNQTAKEDLDFSKINDFFGWGATFARYL